MSTAVATDASSAFLECIDGKDDFLKIEIVNGDRVVLGNSAAENGRELKELENIGGCVIVTNQNGVLLVDATECLIPVKINGQQVGQNPFKPNDILRIGNSIWKMHLPVQDGPTGHPTTNQNSIKQSFNRLIGLEELKDFKLKDIFSKVFKKHSFQDMEEQLITGTIKHTPALTDIETSWAKPWLFSRLLLVSIGLIMVLMISFRMFENPNLIPGLIFIGSFAVPLSTLIFFLEMNAPRNISIFMITTLVGIGGIASLIVALFIFNWFPFLSSWLAASAAGLIEEPAKVLIVVALFGRIDRYKWVLNGLLLGAAIGTGFAAFESAGYAYRSDTFEGIVDSIVLRGLLSPFMHIVWTANAAAALWIVKGERKFELSMLGDMRFLRVMLSSVILHMIWNANFSTIPLPVVLDLKFPVLGIIAWVITFRLVQMGLAQLNQARHAEVQRLAAS
jgi:protease PrsW